jgi:hypothetical protein
VCPEGRDDAEFRSADIRGEVRQALSRWEPSGDVAEMVRDVEARCRTMGADPRLAAAYRAECLEIDAQLPSALARVEIADDRSSATSS